MSKFLEMCTLSIHGGQHHKKDVVDTNYCFESELKRIKGCPYQLYCISIFNSPVVCSV